MRIPPYSGDLDHQRLQPVDGTDHAIAANHRADAFRRAGIDQVTGGDLRLLRQLGDDLRHAPDHVAQVTVLAGLVVDHQLDLALAQVTALRRRGDRAAWRGVLEGFADLPGLLHLLHVGLAIAARHVEADGVAVDMLVGLLGGNVHGAGLHRHHQFRFILEVAGEFRVAHLAAVLHDHVALLLEEERRLLGVVVQLAYTAGAVTPHAVDAAHREGRGFAHHRQADHGRRRKHVVAGLGLGGGAGNARGGCQGDAGDTRGDDAAAGRVDHETFLRIFVVPIISGAVVPWVGVPRGGPDRRDFSPDRRRPRQRRYRATRQPAASGRPA